MKIGPLVIRVERRMFVSNRINILIPLLSILLGLFSASLIFAFLNINPVLIYQKIFDIIFISAIRNEFLPFQDAIRRAIPLMIIASGLCLVFKMNFWNIGGEGQLYMGAFGAALIVYYFKNIHSTLYIPLMIIMSFLIGGLWGIIPAILKAKLEVNEILVTLMLNYIAIKWIEYLVYGPWKDPQGYGFPLTPEFPAEAQLPTVFNSLIHAGLFLGIGAAALSAFIIFKSKLGFEIKVIGDNLKASKYSGINYTKVAIISMIISGGLSGLAGMCMVSGILHRLRPTISPGYGYSAIIVAYLANLNPIAIIPASVFFGLLMVSGEALEGALNIPKGIVYVFEALIFLFLIAGDFIKKYSLRLSLEV